MVAKLMGLGELKNLVGYGGLSPKFASAGKSEMLPNRQLKGVIEGIDKVLFKFAFFIIV